MLNAQLEARRLMEAVNILHKRGYGLLKLVSYIKEGLGEWRYFLFAGDVFPDHIASWPGPMIRGSIPSLHRLDGDTPFQIAAAIEAQGADLLKTAKGSDETYVNWYTEVLRQYPDQVLLMESPDYAEVFHHGPIPVPALKRWTAPSLTPEELLALQEAERNQLMQRAKERRARRRRK